MGCCTSKVADGYPNGFSGYGMGASPAYSGVRGTSKKPVLIAWDMDDISCPPDNASCVQFLNVLHQEFIAKHSRVESRIVAVYDSERELNMSKEATELRLFLQSENVELKSSNGPTVTTVDEVVMNFAISVPRGSTIVIIGNVAEYHEACLYARKKGLCVERILSADGLHRLAEACHANWICSLTDFVTAHGMIDWRRPDGKNFRSSSVAFRSSSMIIVPDSKGGQSLAIMTHEEEKTKEFVAKHISHTGSSSSKSACTAAAPSVEPPPPSEVEENSTQGSPMAQSPPQSTATENAAVPDVTPHDLAGPESAADVTNVDSAAVECTTETQENLPVQAEGSVATTAGLGTNLEQEVVDLAVDSALNNVTDMVSCEMASAGGDLASVGGDLLRTASSASASLPGGFDDMAERAVRASEFAGTMEDAAQESRKSERIVRPSMAVSMFRGRRHIAATIDPDADSDDEDAMEIIPMDDPVVDEGTEECPGKAVAMGPDPMMTWKAQVLRALRGAEDNTVTMESLEGLAPNPIPGSSYSDHLNEHLIGRGLAKWVLENESVQLTQ